MSKNDPTVDDVDDSTLDEYGIWVKAGPEELLERHDEGAVDLVDAAGDAKDDISEPTDENPFDASDNMFLDAPESDTKPAAINILKGQEVAQMSEQEKKQNTSQTDSTLEDQEIILDSEEQLSLDSQDDDLDSLSDLLMNIDEETGEDETIYLEDDDLSLDLEDNSEELMLEQDSSDPQAGDDFSEDIVIPGLDDSLSLDDLNSDADFSLDTPSTTKEPVPPSPASSKNQTADIEVHNIEETGLDEFIDDQLQTTIDDENTAENEAFSMPDDLSLEEESLDSLGMGMADDGEDIILEEGLPDLHDDAEVDVSFDTSDDETMSIPGDMSPLPETEEAAASFSEPTDDSFMESEPEITFDDVEALREDLAEPPVQSPSMRQEDSLGSKPDSGASQILRSIEEELHAIRSELTDLRGELKRLRAKDIEAPSETQGPIGAAGVTQADTVPHQPEAGFIPEDESESMQGPGGGFFDDDEDETIALTGDELDNILNTAEFTEEAGEPSNLDLDEEFDQAFDAGPHEETVSNEEVVSTSEADASLESMDQVAEPDAMPELMSGAVPVYEDSQSSEEFPPIEEINLQEMDASENMLSGSQPQDMEAEATDDQLGGSSSEIETMAQIDIEQELAGIEDLSDEEEDIELYTGTELDSIELDLPEEFAGATSEEYADQTDGELNGIAESDSAEYSTADADKVEAETEPFASQTPAGQSTENADGSPYQHDGDVSFNLKQEIKAVLAYMDRLLESLPEEKIEEFARSEHFEVYKKLFDELGL